MLHSQTFPCIADCSFVNDGTPGQTWATLRNAVSAYANNMSASGAIKGERVNANTYKLRRPAFAFDTGIIPNSATIKSWALGIPSYGTVWVPQATRIHVCKGSYNIPCAEEDFSKLSFTSYGSRDAAEWPTTDFYFWIDGTKMSLINKRGPTKVFALTEFDQKNKAPTVIGLAEQPLYFLESGHLAQLKVEWE